MQDYAESTVVVAPMETYFGTAKVHAVSSCGTSHNIVASRASERQGTISAKDAPSLAAMAPIQVRRGMHITGIAMRRLSI
jgi:hypothetical protein